MGVSGFQHRCHLSKIVKSRVESIVKVREGKITSWMNLIFENKYS
jgi:hypothetical protein